MMTREELNAKKEEELSTWRERREKELVAEGFPEYVGDVAECKEEYIEKFVNYQLDREEPDISDAINEKYKEAEELLDEDEAE